MLQRQIITIVSTIVLVIFSHSILLFLCWNHCKMSKHVYRYEIDYTILFDSNSWCSMKYVILTSMISSFFVLLDDSVQKTFNNKIPLALFVINWMMMFKMMSNANMDSSLACLAMLNFKTLNNLLIFMIGLRLCLLSSLWH